MENSSIAVHHGVGSLVAEKIQTHGELQVCSFRDITL